MQCLSTQKVLGIVCFRSFYVRLGVILNVYQGSLAHLFAYQDHPGRIHLVFEYMGDF